MLLAGNLGALVLIILAGWYFAEQALRPISRMVRQVERITATRLSTRVHEGNGTDEIAQLARTFNQMLGGVEQAFESQKSFVEPRLPRAAHAPDHAAGHAGNFPGLRPRPARDPGAASARR